MIRIPLRAVAMSQSLTFVVSREVYNRLLNMIYVSLTDSRLVALGYLYLLKAATQIRSGLRNVSLKALRSR